MQRTCPLELQSNSVKFGQFVRELLEEQLRAGNVPLIEFSQRTYCFESMQVRGLAVGRRGLLSLLQPEAREVLVQEFE